MSSKIALVPVPPVKGGSTGGERIVKKIAEFLINLLY